MAIGRAPAREQLEAGGNWGQGVAVVSVVRLENGRANAVLGSLGAPSELGLGAIEVIASLDGRYLFASDDYSGEIVFDLHEAIADHLAIRDFVGAVRRQRREPHAQLVGGQRIAVRPALRHIQR